MSGTVARYCPTNGVSDAAPALLRLGTCQAFVVPPAGSQQDRASAEQDPDIGAEGRAGTLQPMPRSLLRATQRWLDASVRAVARFFRSSAVPSSPSPATGRPAARLPLAGRALGFREFTAPHALADGERSRLRVKTTGASARVVPLRLRSPR